MGGWSRLLRRAGALLRSLVLAAALPALAQEPEPAEGTAPAPVAYLGQPRFSLEPYVGLGGKSSTFTLSARLGVRVDRLRVAWIWRAGFYDYQSGGYTEIVKGPRADWLLLESQGFQPVAGLFVGGGFLAVTHQVEGVPDEHGWAAVAGAGVVLGPRLFMPPMAIGLDLQVPLTPGAGPTPVLLFEVSLNPLFVLGAR